MRLPQEVAAALATPGGERSAAEAAALVEWIKSSLPRLHRNLSKSDAERADLLRQMAPLAHIAEFAPEELLLTQNQPSGAFLLLLDGRATAFANYALEDGAVPAADDLGEVARELGPGDSCGCEGVLQGPAPERFSVRAGQWPVRAVLLPRSPSRFTSDACVTSLEQREAALRSMWALAKLPACLHAALARAGRDVVVPASAADREPLYEAGAPVAAVHVVLAGAVQLELPGSAHAVYEEVQRLGVVGGEALQDGGGALPARLSSAFCLPGTQLLAIPLAPFRAALCAAEPALCAPLLAYGADKRKWAATAKSSSVQTATVVEFAAQAIRCCACGVKGHTARNCRALASPRRRPPPVEVVCPSSPGGGSLSPGSPAGGRRLRTASADNDDLAASVSPLAAGRRLRTVSADTADLLLADASPPGGGQRRRTFSDDDDDQQSKPSPKMNPPLSASQRAHSSDSFRSLRRSPPAGGRSPGLRPARRGRKVTALELSVREACRDSEPPSPRVADAGAAAAAVQAAVTTQSPGGIGGRRLGGGRRGGVKAAAAASWSPGSVGSVGSPGGSGGSGGEAGDALPALTLPAATDQQDAAVVRATSVSDREVVEGEVVTVFGGAR